MQLYHSEFMEEASAPYLKDEETEATCGPSARPLDGSKAQLQLAYLSSLITAQKVTTATIWKMAWLMFTYVKVFLTLGAQMKINLQH